MALRIPLKWLQDYVDVEMPPHQLAERLTLAGLEVESITAVGADWDRQKLVVGHVTAVNAHPDADKLCLVTVDYGQAEPITVVTGAPNLVAFITTPLPKEPFKVALALLGAQVIDGHAMDGSKMVLKPVKLRGVRSEGMVCSEYELGLSEAHEGIMFLPPDAPTGTALADYLGDHVVEFDIKGGFAHLQSIYGIAREVAALTQKPLKRDFLKGGKGLSGTAKPDFVKLEIASPDACSRYVALLIEEIKMGPSPFWMQQRLLRAGMRPINVVVDVTNYVMLELGQPLHAFDYHQLKGEGGGAPPLIRVRKAAKGEKITTLDKATRPLDPEMVLITDGGGPIAVAGVMGGQESEVSAKTTTVLLESANFEFLNNRRTSQLLKLRTEASDRFGKDLDAEQALPAAIRAAELLAQLCGGRVRQTYGDLYPQPAKTQPIAFSQAYVRRMLGMEIPLQESGRILNSLEFLVTPSKEPETLMVTPPTYRKDATRPADLLEEVVRIYGYDRMEATLIQDALPPQRRNPLLEGTGRTQNILSGCGLDEIITYSIIAKADEEKLYPNGGAPAANQFVGLKNPLDHNRGHLRRRLLPEALNTVRNNLRFLNRAAVFEVGQVFHPVEGQVLPQEPLKLCAVMTGPRHPDNWLEKRKRPLMDFFDIKGVVEGLMAGMEIEKVGFERSDNPAYHPGRSARVLINGIPAGDLGELHPKVAAAFGLPNQPVCAMEIDLDALIAQWREDKRMEPISIHPPIYEDLAFVVDMAVSAERMHWMIFEAGRPLLRQVMLFDVYEGEKLGPGKKSLAYALTFQAEDRTLSDKDVAKVRQKIIKRLEAEMGAELRSL